MTQRTMGNVILGTVVLIGTMSILVAPTRAATRLEELPTIELPAIDLAAVRQEDQQREQQGMAPRYAIVTSVLITPRNDGVWERVGDERVWRLRVHAPGALSLNLGFTRYHMPAGGRLSIHSTDLSRSIRDFTNEDNEVHGQLWTPVILSDDIVVELAIPDGAEGRFLLELTSIGYGYRGFGEIAAETGAMSGACNVDVVCPEGDPWRDQITTVAVISTGGSTFCTGFMVNNTAQDRTPYFMTANHCGIGSGNAPSLVAFWNYENSFCRVPGSSESGQPGDGSLDMFQTGSIFRAGASPSDFTLVQLDDDPDPSWNVGFAGWDRSDADGTSAVGIHHPNTEEKRISFENDPTTTTSYLGTSVPGDGTHIRITDWDLGTTEPGSSGSPLFNQDKRIVGQLHGGFAACGNDSSDWYGRFSVSWDGASSSSRLRDWLDPGNTGAMTIDFISSGPQCQGPSDCNDFNVCTSDACVNQVCIFTNISGPCTDNDLCTSNDQCIAGACVGTATDCNDNDPCTDDSCDSLTGLCGHVDNSNPCDDGDACTTNDTCAGGICAGQSLNCDDGDPCTLDTCDSLSGCQHQAFTGPCDDGDGCTLNDECVAGVCSGTPKDCDDGNTCTNDGCESSTGQCQNTNNTNGCDDGDPCTENDTCANGQCTGANVDCADGNPCTDDTCDPVNGCVNTNNSIACNDGDPCTGNDTCGGGVCAGVPVNCDDGDPCTDDACDAAAGCLHALNSAPCDDGDPCTSDDVCSVGFCAGVPADCDDGNPCTTDSCDALMGGCVHVAFDGPCDDGTPCTTGDMCAGGTCVGDPLDCDDGDPCTEDLCDPEVGCQNIEHGGACDDGDPCTNNDVCTAGSCAGEPVNCDNGDPCDGVESCQPQTGDCQSEVTDDCNQNGIEDACDLANCAGEPACADCNENGALDECDIASGASSDVNVDGRPDECASCVNNAMCAGGGVCQFFQCIDGSCFTIPSAYGDIAGKGGACGADGLIDLSDVLAALDGFSGEFSEGCERANIDIAGQEGSCVPNGLIDLSDILAVLDAFQGQDNCCAQAARPPTSRR